MKVNVETVNPTRHLLTIQVEADQIAREEASLIMEFAKQARLPGFRPGKAPAAIVKQKYAKDIAQELNRKLTNEAYEAAMKESDLEVYSVVNFEGGDFKTGAPGEVKFTVDVLPEVTLPEYKGIRMEVPPTAVSEEEIDKALEELRGQRAEYNVVEKAAEAGDFVRCGYTGKVGDALISELAPDASMYGTQASTWEEAGSADAPGVRAVIDGVVGMKAGDTKEVTMNFGDDFHIEELRGKTGTYELVVEEVREKVLPEMDEAFLKGLQVESLDQLKEQTKANLEGQKQQASGSAKREQLNKALLDRTDFPLPESALEETTQGILQDFLQRSAQQGVPMEEFEQRREELFEGASRAAADRLKLRILILKIAEKEEITVENEDLSALIMQEAMMTRTQPDKLVKELQKDRQRINALRETALMNKTVDFLIKEGEIVEVTPEVEGAAE